METKRRTQRKDRGHVTPFTESLTRPLLDPDRRLPGPYEPAVGLVGAEVTGRYQTTRPHVGRFMCDYRCRVGGGKVSKNRAARRSFWLIATRAHGWREVLTIDAGGETVLPVFSFQEEGESFLRLEGTEADWWTRWHSIRCRVLGRGSSSSSSARVEGTSCTT